MKVQRFFNPGTTKVIEDRIIYTPKGKVFGVVDGMSQVYEPDKGGPILYEGKSGGQVAVNIIQATLQDEDGQAQSLEEMMGQVCGNLVDFRRRVFSPEDAASFTNPLPGAAFAVARPDESRNQVRILTGEDSFAMWKFRAATRGWGASPHQGYKSEKDMSDAFWAYVRDCSGDMKKTWQWHTPHLLANKQERFNNRASPNMAAFLNGDLRVADCWFSITIPLSDLEYLLLFTDGLVSLEESETSQRIIDYVSPLFLAGGFEAVFEETSRLEKMKGRSIAEASALAIQF